jgi:hypothetical protein
MAMGVFEFYGEPAPKPIVHSPSLNIEAFPKLQSRKSGLEIRDFVSNVNKLRRGSAIDGNVRQILP